MKSNTGKGSVYYAENLQVLMFCHIGKGLHISSLFSFSLSFFLSFFSFSSFPYIEQEVSHRCGLVHPGHRARLCGEDPQGSGLLGQTHCRASQEPASFLLKPLCAGELEGGEERERRGRGEGEEL